VALEVIAYEILRIQSAAAQASKPDVAGVGQNVVTIHAPQPVPHPYKWLITGATVTCSSGSPTFSMFDQDPSNPVVPINSSVAGILDADNSGELLIEPGDQLFLQWFKVPFHAVCKARVQYQMILVTPPGGGTDWGSYPKPSGR
jgi:hypothetical protein